MKRILFPTDMTEASGLALPHAINLAALGGGELHLLHVMTLHSTGELIDELDGEDDAREALDGLLTGATRVIRSVTRGIAAAPAILEYADLNDIDAIVMGCHGRRGFRRLMLGSVTEEVIRSGRWPVMAVRATPDHTPATANYSRILAPVDFSKNTASGLVMAADLARRFGARLDILHTVEIPTMPEFYGIVSATTVDVERTTVKATEEIQHLAESLGSDLDVHTEVRVGGAVGHILDLAEEGVDLIVMPTHGHSGLDRVILGSVAEEVLRRARCPVLTLKPGSE